MFFKRLAGLFSQDLAMDLGTANTLLYTPKDGIILNEPSVVAFNTRTGEIMAVGKEAKEFLGRTPDRVSAVRPLKDGVIADFEVTRVMVSYFIKKMIKKFSRIHPCIAICVPTGITQVEKRAVIESAQQAGAGEVKLVEEPMAAAIGAGLPITAPQGNMVIDIGGGTTEVAVISLSSVAYSESIRVAGDEINEAVQRFFQDQFQMLIGENQAERIKIGLGTAVPLENKILRGEVTGKSVVNSSPCRVQVTDEDIRQAIAEPVAAIVQAAKRALEKTPPELVADIAQNGLLLAGGGALLKGLDSLLVKEVNLNVVVDEDPLTTVARGTGETIKNKKLYQNVFIS